MLKNHLKIAWRSLTKRKGFALINILGLALGFGCSILIFLFVSHHLQFDKFHNNTDRVYRFVTEEHRDIIDYDASVPPGFANAFKTDYDYAEKIAKIVTWNDEIITLENDGQKLKIDEGILFAETDFFKIFNFPLVNGSDQIPISELNTAVITERMSHRLFGDENPVGKTFKLGNQELITITGLLKNLPKTSFIEGDIFISFETIKKYNGFLGGEFWGGISSNLQCFGLLRPDQNIAQIEEVLSGYVTKFRPKSKNVHHYKLQALADIHFDSKYGGGIDINVLWIFSLIGFFILVVASINFINISTAQSINRSKEVGVRKVLGGFKGQLFWQFMTETLIITILALLMGVLLAVLSLPYFNSIFDLNLSPSGLLNPSFFMFVLALLVGITLLAGSYPGLLLARISPILALKRKLSQQDSGGYVTRKVLVTVQFVISIVLIIGTLVVNKQIEYAIDSDLGFDKSTIVMVSIPEDLEAVQLKGLKERISESSGVKKITACYASPGAGDSQWGTNLKYNNRPEDEEFSVQVKIGDKDYLNTFALQLLAGRNFYEKDSVDEVLVNETFVKKLGLSSIDEILGKPLAISGDYIRAKVVGVIRDFHDRDFHENINPIFIAPATDNYLEFAIKINTGQTQNTMAHIETQWSKSFPDYVFDYEFLDNRVAELYNSEQRFLSLTKLFSGLAIFIGCLGIYGLILFFVIQKTREIGIRKVLGGGSWHIVGLVMQDFIKLIGIAGLIASPLAWYFMNQWLQNFTYKTDFSLWIFALAIGIVALITTITISYQAIRATRVNPVKSLRTE